MTPRFVAIPALALTAVFGLLPGGARAALGDGSPAAAPADGAAAPASTGGHQLSYLVNARPGGAAAARVAKAVAAADGSVVTAYDQIGVTVARSANPGFAAALRAVPGVASAGATRTSPLTGDSGDSAGSPDSSAGGAATHPLTRRQQDAAAARAARGQDPLEPLQWDLGAIRADQAHRTTLGSPDVTVAVLDSGVDDTHPDLAPNFDRGASVNCVSGKPDTSDGAWRPTDGDSPHGTHVAGEIAAAKNGIGMTGVAPGVRVASIKVATTNGMYYAESVVCGFVWAAEHGVDVTNSSYYVDPWYFACAGDPDQRALADAVRRAAEYAEHRGVVNVAAAGNDNDDLASHSLTDTSSPDDGTPRDRTVDPASCPELPAQLPGVVSVSATGAKGLKSSFSNYGLGQVDIAAPGGDSTTYQPPGAPAVSGGILGTLPGGKYGYMAGTSMATPHVAGVAALIKSTHPHASAREVTALLRAEADERACPARYDIDGDGTVDAVCHGGPAHNGFYGAGTADALAAVRR